MFLEANAAATAVIDGIKTGATLTTDMLGNAITFITTNPVVLIPIGASMLIGGILLIKKLV